MKIKKSLNLLIGIGIIIPMMILVVISFFNTPYDIEVMDSSKRFIGISWEHWMGCDHFGRDIFSRVLVGTNATVRIGVLVLFIGAISGLIIGALAGYFGGIIDQILMAVINILFAFPSILLALVVIGILGVGERNLIIALGVSFAPSFARIVRGEFIRCSKLDYVINARLAGASHMRIIVCHIIPNIMPILISSMMIGFNNAILAEAGMSYLGIGIQPPNPSLGQMLSEAQGYLFVMPMYAFFPGMVIVLLVLGSSLIADGLNRR